MGFVMIVMAESQLCDFLGEKIGRTSSPRPGAMPR